MLTLLNIRHLLLGSTPLQVSTVVATDVPNVIETPQAPFPFLSLPLDLRFYIYQIISGPPSSSSIHKNPLCKFLLVNHQTRLEASSIFYRRSGLVFSHPSPCISFLNLGIKGMNLGLLTSLALSVPDGDTFSLEPVFRLLVEEDVGLTVLVLTLECKPKRGGGVQGGKGLTKGGGEDMLERARGRASNLEVIYERNTRKGKVLLGGEGSSDSGVNVLRGPSFLGKLKSVRYLVIDGNPFDEWSIEFELGLLALHERMFKSASRGGGSEGLPWFGRWGDWFWFGSRKFMGRRGFVERFGGLNPVLG